MSCFHTSATGIQRGKITFYSFLPAILLFFLSCNENSPPSVNEIVALPEKMDEKVKDLIQANLEFARSNNEQLGDSTRLFQFPVLLNLYGQKDFTPRWCSAERWLPSGDSLLQLIDHVRYFGLFPEDYHTSDIKKIKTLFATDSLKNGDTKNAALWARADLLMSDALVNIFHDVKLGRLPKDSITMRKDSVLSEAFIAGKFTAIASGLSLSYVISSLEPRLKAYHELKDGLKNFLDSATFGEITTITFPSKDKESLKTSLVRRFYELGYLDSANEKPDSLKLASILKKYQQWNNLAADGKLGSQTVRSLNLSDLEKFKRIAITLDRYKMLPEKMPDQYIWANIPSYTLLFIRHDTLLLSSRIVVGKPKTRTPVLTSALYEMITYPQWNIPQSIIVNEILPALKKDPGYLASKGYSLFKGEEEVDPYTVDWSQYNKGIPYRIIQGSGDDNALGVLKFNFHNKYAVYLHDTNQRSYFALDNRALSHGCVRIQEWQKLAVIIMQIESEKSNVNSKQKPVSADSLFHWLKVKEKRSAPLINRVPIFIRYFTCEASDGRISFFDDIYEEDEQLSRMLFASKKSKE
jgi:murein L,D-transpeptidase YcbB/YkuD